MIEKIAFFGRFLSFVNGTLKVAPPNSSGQNISVMFNDISKNLSQKFLYFFIKYGKPSNQGFFEWP